MMSSLVSESLSATLYDRLFSEEDPSIFKQRPRLPSQKIINTPYGGRLQYTLPKGNTLMVHFKDKQLIRHKKRWSQVGVGTQKWSL